MKKQTPVSEIMTKDLVVINKDQSLQEANDIIKNKQIRHIPVTSGEKVVGMLSKTDLHKISFINTFDGDELTTAMYDHLTVGQVMTRELSTIQHTDTISDVAKILSENEFHALPVMDGAQIVGIVTTTDLIKYMLEQL